MTARATLLGALALAGLFAASLALTVAFLAYRGDAMGIVLGVWRLCL